MTCILCKRTGGIFNIYTVYGNANHNVRDDITEIFGTDADPFLCPTDCVCNVCMNMLENVVTLKWRLWRAISNENNELKPINLGKIWELFATFKREEDDREDDGVICRTPTPSNLLVLTHSKDYNPSLEEQIQIMERNRSLSRASSGVGRSDVSETSEIIKIFNKKRKRHKRTNWTHRKRHSTSRPNSDISHRTFPPRRKARRGQNDSPLSDCSYASFYTMHTEKSSTRKRRDRNSEPNRSFDKRTRSASREQAEELETLKFYCTEKDCPLYCKDLDVLNHHKIMHHNMLALHYCDECQQRYTTAEHLRLHKKVHDVYPFWCLLCLAEVKSQEELQKHLDEHALYSVPCKYCDKSFLTKSLREKHHKSAHTGQRERIIYRDDIILDRIDKNDSPEDTDRPESPDPPYMVFLSSNTDAGCSSSWELDVTSENMRLMNTVTCDESSSDESELIESESANRLFEVS